jgi:N4-gp56 family major capsid protein
MALTTAVAGLTPQLWDDKYFTSYVRANQFAKYMGTSENALIQVKEDLTKKSGESITYALVNDLVGAGVTGNTALEGAEEALGSRSFRLYVAMQRNGVVVHEWDQQKSAIDLRNAARPQLRNWSLKKMRTDIILALNSLNGIPYITGEGNGTTGTSNAQKDAWLVDNADRALFGGAKGNNSGNDFSACLTTLDATNDKFTYTNLSLARRTLKQASPAIRPIMLEDGTEWYVAFAPSNAFRDLKTSLATVMQNAEVRGKGNPLFSDGDLIWDGVIVREIPEMTVEANVGDGGTVDVAHVKICGAQALACGWAQRTVTRTETRDYGALSGVGISEIRGIAKMSFGKGVTDLVDLVDHGVFSHFVAAEPDA